MAEIDLELLADWAQAVAAGLSAPALPADVAAALTPLSEANDEDRKRVVALEAYLETVSDLMLSFSTGDFDLEVPVSGDDLTDAVSLGMSMMVEELHAMTDSLASARDAALAANTAKSHFLANMSHELRTPLNAIIGYSELIRDDLAGDDDSLASDLDKILRAARHLLKLIGDVLDLSKVEAGKMEVLIDAVDVGQLVGELEETVAPSMQRSGNRFLVTSLDLPLRPVGADGMKIRQIVFNLLSNAAKFTKDGEVSLHVHGGPDRLCFEVKDTGGGIAPDRLQAIFDPFTQARVDTSRWFGGTGLGLAICRRFAQLMGGTLTVSSELGVGSLFTFEVPVYVHEPTPMPAPRKGSLPLGTPVVLIVDDDPSAREVIHRHMAPMGCDFLHASSGPEALELAVKHRPSLITLDVLMPLGDGWTALSLLKTDERTSDIPVVVISVMDSPGRAVHLGAQDFLLKPVNRDLLLSTVSRHIRSPRRHVLVVDDDPDVREVASRLLGNAGYEVSLATGGAEALELLVDLRPDLVLLDLMMPNVDGFEVVGRLRESTSFDAPIVVFTAKELTLEDRVLLDRGATAVLQKGRDLEGMVGRIESLLAPPD